MLRLALASVLTLAFATPAIAQPADPDPDRVPGLDDVSVGIIPTGISAPIAVVEGDGVKIGEGTAVYPTVGLDTGFINNVFYEETSTSSAGMLRLIAGVGTGSLSRARLTPRSGGYDNPGTSQHRADLRLSYNFWLSGNDYINDQNGLGIAATFRGVLRPQRTWSFLYLDNFERVIRAANFESSRQTNRDINRLVLGLQWAPNGRSVRGLLTYTNTLDVFEEDSQRFANRWLHALALTAAWRFRPVTVLSATFSQGMSLGIGEGTAFAREKTNSYPLAASAAIQTLLTLKTSLTGRVGYTNGFYSSGASYGTVLGGVELGYRYSPIGRAIALYEYRHEDSINANYYRDHIFRIGVEQHFVPFAVSVVPELRLRHYAGISTLVPGYIDTRNDLIVAVTAAARYNFRNSLAAVLQYQFSTVQTDYMYTVNGDTDDPSFARHELFLGFRAAL